MHVALVASAERNSFSELLAQQTVQFIADAFPSLSQNENVQECSVFINP